MLNDGDLARTARVIRPRDMAADTRVSRRLGTVTNVGDNWLDAAIGAGQEIVEQIPHVNSYIPHVGDHVWIDIKGGDPLAIGSSSDLTHGGLLGFTPYADVDLPADFSSSTFLDAPKRAAYNNASIIFEFTGCTGASMGWVQINDNAPIGVPLLDGDGSLPISYPFPPPFEDYYGLGFAYFCPGCDAGGSFSISVTFLKR